MAFIRRASSPVNGNEKTLQIAGEEIFFPMSMGNNWGKIRIGWRCCLQGASVTQDISSSLMNDWRCGVAICNGRQGFFHPAPTDVFAVFAGGSSYATVGAVLTTIPATMQSVFNNAFTMAQKRGSTNTSVAASNSSGAMPLRCYTSTSLFYTAFYFDFDRVTTAGSIIVSVFGRTLAQLTTVPNTTFDLFMTGMFTSGTPANMTNLSAASQTVAYTGTLNVFDTISIFSNATANNVLEIATLAVARVL